MAGILLRLLVFTVLKPLDNDTGHLDVIKFMVEHHRLPSAMTNSQSFHPPLYYLLAAPLYAATDSVKAVQVLSLVFSVLTLILFYRLLNVDRLIEGRKPRLYAFLFACFLPQFVLYGLYVSNDTLAVFLGALLVVQVVRYIKNSRGQELVFLGLVESLGLLTKATFLAFLPALFMLVMFACLRRGRSVSRAFGAAFLLLVLSCTAGSYKFIRNYMDVGDPFFSNLDMRSNSWVAQQELSYHGSAIPCSFMVRFGISTSPNQVLLGAVTHLSTIWDRSSM